LWEKEHGFLYFDNRFEFLNKIYITYIFLHEILDIFHSIGTELCGHNSILKTIHARQVLASEGIFETNVIRIFIILEQAYNSLSVRK